MDNTKYVIVVGIDYTAASDRALQESFVLARTRYGSQLHVANVRGALGTRTTLAGVPIPLPPWAQWATELREYVAHKAAEFEATAGAAPLQHLYTHQRMNDPARELAALAAEVKADLLIVGTHQWHVAPGASRGSVAEAVCQIAACPVLVVSPPSASDAKGPGTAEKPTSSV